MQLEGSPRTRSSVTEALEFSPDLLMGILSQNPELRRPSGRVLLTFMLYR